MQHDSFRKPVLNDIFHTTLVTTRVSTIERSPHATPLPSVNKSLFNTDVGLLMISSVTGGLLLLLCSSIVIIVCAAVAVQRKCKGVKFCLCYWLQL